MHGVEAGLAQQGLEHLGCAKAEHRRARHFRRGQEAGDAGLRACDQRHGIALGPDRQRDAAARREDATDLGQCLLRMREHEQRQSGQHAIDTAVGQAQVLRVGRGEVQAAARRVAACAFGQHAFGDVGGQHFARGLDERSRAQGEQAGAAGEVEHALARSQAGGRQQRVGEFSAKVRAVGVARGDAVEARALQRLEAAGVESGSGLAAHAAGARPAKWISSSR